MRSGAQTLDLLATPLTAAILRTLGAGARQQAELRREIGLPAQTTLRAQLKRLVSLDILEKRRRDRFPGALEYELTDAGRELLSVVDVLEGWLEQAPEGRLELGGRAAKTVVKALTEGWSTTMVRALAAGPLSLTKLDSVIGSLSYPSLERRLTAMRLAGQVEAARGDGRGTPYAIMVWLRRGIAPLLSACRWEHRHQMHFAVPLAALDIEAMFLLSLPLLTLPPAATGTCRIAAEVRGGRKLAGVMVKMSRGTIVSYQTKLEGMPKAWALGSVGA